MAMAAAAIVPFLASTAACTAYRGVDRTVMPTATKVCVRTACVLPRYLMAVSVIRELPGDVAATSQAQVPDRPTPEISWRAASDRGVQVSPLPQLICTLTKPPVGTSCGAASRPRSCRVKTVFSSPRPTSVTWTLNKAVCRTCMVVRSV